MIIYQVYDETAEQAQVVAERLKEALARASAHVFVVPSGISSEIKQARGIFQCPAIVRHGKVVLQGSEPTEELIHQWVAQHSAQCDEVEGAYGNFGYDESK